MSWNLLLGTLKQRWQGLFWSSLSLVSYSWLMVWYWPVLGESYKELASNLPKEFLQAFAGGDIDLATMGGFFQTEYLGLMWIAILGSAVILYASKAIGSEIGAGTMELLLAQPISRMKFVVTRIVGLVVYVVVVVASTVVPIWLLGPQYDINLPGRTLWLLGATGTLLGLAIGGIAFLLSAVSRDGGKPAGISAGILGVMWVLHAVAQLADWADALEPVNLLKYWTPANLIDYGTVEPETWWVYGGVALVTLAASIVVFARRDAA